MKFVAKMAAIVALTSLSLVAVANAHTVKHDSTVTIQLKKGKGQDPDSFSGKVNSVRTRCESGRTVKIFRRADVVGEADVLVGKTTTDADGNYEFVLPGEAAPGTYFAVAKREVLRRSANHLHVCKRATSADRTVN